ncbi:hypothetical protein [Allobaculum mucilyticum]|uniref:hypothetical protein n=1 Tax=Allobaculum mucilyticum TaxID=2834459 RepID=UPI001F604AA7|nr:hypothetical protein [Allobaculum mucilyticum]UNT95850.1 hypothetical protein KWG62_11210 [Allobaculum mucilyticum]UNT96547.1 hypothetical protein KWG62_01950 [Allobaculum mucilyticum]UNT96594.1 hypothetical protein KWG62_02195 [Allobaculum mucilyticum]
MNAEFDALNSVFTDALLQPGSEKNEDSALLELAQRSSFQKAIFIADRGYEALMSFYRLQKEHVPLSYVSKTRHHLQAFSSTIRLPSQKSMTFLSM